MNDNETSDQSSSPTKAREAVSGVKTENYYREGHRNQEMEETSSSYRETTERGQEIEIIPNENETSFVESKSCNSGEGTVCHQIPPCVDLSCEMGKKAKISFTKECNVVLTRCDENSPRDTVVSKSVSPMKSNENSRVSRRKTKENNSHSFDKKTVEAVDDPRNINEQIPCRKVAIKHNSRHVSKRMKSEDDVWEITEVVSTDPLAPVAKHSNSVNKSKKRRKVERTENNTIVVSNTAQLLQIAKSKYVKTNKEPTIVIIDTNSILSGKGPVPITKLSLVDPIPQSPEITRYSGLPAAHNSWCFPSGTSIQTLPNLNCNPFAVPKNVHRVSSQISHLITNDLELIEAPSFIVPYLFIQNPEQSLKKYIELLQNEKPIDSYMDARDFTNVAKDESKQILVIESKKCLIKNCAENNKNICSKYNGNDKIIYDVNHNSLTESNVKVIGNKSQNIKSLEDNSSQKIENSKSVQDNMSMEKENGITNSENYNVDYFNSPLGKFFFDIGNSLVKQHVYSDLKKNMQIKDTELIEKNQMLQFHSNKFGTHLEYNEKDIEPFHFEIKKCTQCTFQTESLLVMAHHLEIPHKYNHEFKCNYCNLTIETQDKAVCHMATEHNSFVCFDSVPAQHQCPNCFYEDNRKNKVNSHMVSCSKKFKPDQNQEPSPDWDPPGKIMRRPRIPTKRGKVASSYHMPLKGFRQLLPKLPPNIGIHHDRTLPEQRSVYSGLEQTTTCQKPLNISSKQVPFTAGWQKPNISITPLPNIQSTSSVNVKNSIQESTALLVKKHQDLNDCEICDSHFRDLGELQTHLQQYHRAKFSKQTLLKTPSLKCPRCTCSFFTYQGLERHLLGTHGLVTSNIQEAAQNEKDGGRCQLCGKFFKNKLLYHVSIEHKINLKLINMSYKCILCRNETFGKYEQFEQHVLAIHHKPKVRKHSEIPDNISNDLKSQKDDSEIMIISHIKTNHVNIATDSFNKQKNQQSPKIEKSIIDLSATKDNIIEFRKSPSMSKQKCMEDHTKEEKSANQPWFGNNKEDKIIPKIKSQNRISEDSNSEKHLAADNGELTEHKYFGNIPYTCPRDENFNNSDSVKSNQPTNNQTETRIQINNENEVLCNTNRIDKSLIDKEDLTVNGSLKNICNKNGNDTTDNNKSENLKDLSYTELKDSTIFENTYLCNDMEINEDSKDSRSQQEDNDLEFRSLHMNEHRKQKEKESELGCARCIEPAS